MKRTILALLLAVLAVPAFSQTPSKTFKTSDFYKIPALSSAEISPDGKWVAYSVSTVDTAKDKRVSHLWMQSWDGKQSIQLTHGAEPASRPKWSPDGMYISFLSSRESKNGSQLWLMDRRGGEAKKVTDIKGDLGSYEWSHDGKKLVMVIQDPENNGKDAPKTPKPIVIDRYHFKQDYEGYLENLHTHLYIFNIETKKLDTLTKGKFDESSPLWSPDGKSIVFVSNRDADPDRSENTDIFTIEARAGGNVKQLTTWKGHDVSPRWSPDGKYIAYLRQDSEGYNMYDENILCLMNADGSDNKLLSKEIDRPAASPEWSKDGKSIAFLVDDDRERYAAVYNLQSRKISVMQSTRGKINLDDVIAHSAGNWLVSVSTPRMPFELYALEGNKLRRLTHHQQEWSKDVQFAQAMPFQSTSKDGTKVSGILYRQDSTSTKKLPFILFIHGGPVGQDDYGFDATSQALAAAGYAVASVNYRGSSGRGIEYTRAINADWGNKEVIDLQGAVDELVKRGIADPDKLGVGGWSYGGILTDFMIASDTRFKAAASGAGSALQVANYGIDQYVLQYDNELGQPWKNPDVYTKISYPFYHADRIKTPVLFMSGLKDFNVPTAGSEHMYQALKSLGIDAELILYPNQFHGISTPSYQVDRVDRYIKWFDKYLK
ncbi:S9 family peptidase [Mucilaginibacter terrenus]|uniref:Acyl-peptide hydrolase n=1 Tax=Mucilaginibacter terrenus TaxID=2482727 RepID=A0A3E2NX88_9SPHI|nr:S9 family peptidase [Mucilaginibacter terrenus]RFZ85531.1 S9 family peptidase [Mucilaginibacter terrenus]